MKLRSTPKKQLLSIKHTGLTACVLPFPAVFCWDLNWPGNSTAEVKSGYLIARHNTFLSKKKI
jgi:hypothetical protein